MTKDSDSYAVPLEQLPIEIQIVPSLSLYAVVVAGVILVVLPVILFVNLVLQGQITFFPWCLALLFYGALGVYLVRDTLRRLRRNELITISSEFVKYSVTEGTEAPKSHLEPMKNFTGVRYRLEKYYSPKGGSQRTYYIELVHKESEKTICLRKLHFNSVGPTGVAAEFEGERKRAASILNVPEIPVA